MPLPNSNGKRDRDPDIARAIGENPTLAANFKYPHRRVEPVEALDALATCDGNIVEASRRLEASPQSILAAITGDEDGYNLQSRYLRAFTMTKTFELVARLNSAVLEAIDEGDLKPQDAARTLVGLVQSMASLTDAGQSANNVDPYAALMRILPAEEREALKALVPAANAFSRAPAATQPAALPPAPEADVA